MGITKEVCTSSHKKHWQFKKMHFSDISEFYLCYRCSICATEHEMIFKTLEELREWVRELISKHRQKGKR